MKMKQLYSIKKMTYASLFIIFFLLIITFVFMFINNMISLLEEREQDNIMQQGRIANGILEYSLRNAQAVTRDWSSWDETYSFAFGENPAYVEDTLTDYPFLLHNFNFLVIKDLDKNVLYERFFDFQTEEDLPIPEGFTDYLDTAVNEMYKYYEPGKIYSFQEKLGKDGLFFYNGVCYFICTLPILTSDETSDLAGSYTFGRIIDEREIRRMAISEENLFTVLEASSPETANLTFNDGYAVSTEKDSIKFYMKHSDYFGGDSIVIMVEKTRDLYNMGFYYITITVVVLGAVIITLFALLVVIINRLILRPLYKLSADVETITAETLSIDGTRFGNSHEFFTLTSAINDMLGRLAENKRELEQKNLRLDRMAYYDHFTGMPNRFDFNRSISEAMMKALTINNKITVLFFDIDRLKLINDTMGHNFGDQLIKEVSIRLKESLPGLYIARMAGGEFAAILQNGHDSEAVKEAAGRILDVFKNPFIMQNRDFRISVSVGSSIFPDDSSVPDELVRNADIAMHKAKTLGGNAYIQFTSVLNEEISQRLFIEQRIVRGLENDEFIPYFQPKVYSVNKKIFGFEALARWRSKEGMVMPDVFIPIAEETGQIVPISWIILRKACQYNQMLVNEGFDTTIAVNMTSQVLLHKKFFEILEDVIRETGMDIRRLDIEITEGTLIDDVENTNIVLKKLSTMGVGISVDDFGTGYSALSYLKKLNVDRIKIDRSFIKDLPFEKDSAAIVDAIVAMSRSLGLLTTSEGVETEEQFEYLREKGCDEIQGYFIKPPVPFNEIKDLMINERSSTAE